MEYNDYINPVDDNVFDMNEKDPARFLEDSKSMDRGYNKLFREIEDDKGRMKRTKVEFYTSNLSPGSAIRDAITGEYMPHKVGSLDEELYFKVALTSGECKSKNGSNKLFYSSPEAYMNHLQEEVSMEILKKWQVIQKDRICMNEITKRPRVAVVVK